MNDSMKLKGHIKIVVTDPAGNVTQSMEKDNVVVSVGKVYLAEWLAAASQAGEFMSWIGLGEGTSVANAADTDIETPLDDRLQGTVSSNSNTWQNVTEFGPGESTGDVSEAGLFSAETSGTMLARQVFTAVPKGADETLEITWTITFN